MKIAIIGCGFIGGAILDAVRNGTVDVEVVCVFDSDPQRTGSAGVPVVPDISGVLDSGAALVVECASQRAVAEYGVPVLESGKSLMVMSVGALSDDALFARLRSAALKNSVRIYLPSGAIGALDALSAAGVSGLEGVSITTRKPPASLGLSASEEVVVFDGVARDAVRKFPQNVNVAATLSIAGIGFDQTKVRVIADPNVSRNVHEVSAWGGFGRFTFRVENLPSKNPKTSLLAALSAVACLKKITSPVQVG